MINMSLSGIWKGEIISPGEENDSGEDDISSAILIINHHNFPGPFTGILDYNPEDGIEESAKVIGEVNFHEVSFVLMLSKFYYKNYYNKIAMSNSPHPETFLEGKIIRGGFMTGTWIVHKSYRLINTERDLLFNSPFREEREVVIIRERKGSWWFKKVREHQNKE